MDIKSGSSSEKKRSFFQRRLSPHSPDTGPSSNPLLLPGSGSGGGGGSKAGNNNSIINLAKNHRSSSLTKTNSSTSVGSAGGGVGPFSGIPKATGPKNADAIGAQLMSHVTSTNNNKGKPSAVAFDEAAAASSATRPMKASTATSKAVNGILRKGSVPGNDIVTTTAVTLTAKASPPTTTEPDRGGLTASEKTASPASNETKKRGKSKSRSKQKSASKSSGKLASLSESAGEDGGGGGGGGGSVTTNTGRSRSNSTKSNKEKEKADKIQKDLALTRDLPWCGCWGNGCL